MAPRSSLVDEDRNRAQRKNLVPLLQEAQEEEGYISLESVKRIARKLRISENEIFGVTTFYTQFRLQPPGKYNIKVCLGTACHVGGGQNFMEVMKTNKNLSHGETSPDQKFSLERVACLGCCALAPVVVVNDEVHGRMNRVTFMQLLESLDPSGQAEDSSETTEPPG